MNKPLLNYPQNSHQSKSCMFSSAQLLSRCYLKPGQLTRLSSLGPRLSPQKQGEGRAWWEKLSTSGTWIWWYQSDCKETTWTHDYFVGVYFCFCATAQIVDSKMEDCSGIQCLKLQYLQKLHKEWARLLDNSPNDVMQYHEVNSHCPLLSLGQSRQWSCLTMAGWSSLPPMVCLKLL